MLLASELLYFRHVEQSAVEMEKALSWRPGSPISEDLYHGHRYMNL